MNASPLGLGDYSAVERVSVNLMEAPKEQECLRVTASSTSPSLLLLLGEHIGERKAQLELAEV